MNKTGKSQYLLTLKKKSELKGTEKKRAYILSTKVGGGYLDLCGAKYIMRTHWILNVKSIFERGDLRTHRTRKLSLRT